MPRIKSRKFTAEQRCELQELLNTTSSVNIYRRTKMLLYLDEGSSPEEIRKHTGYAERAQFFWLHRYRESGIQGLADRPRSGRPRTREAPVRLEKWARITLEQMHANHPTAYLRKRAQMVLLWDKGYQVLTIAEIVGVSAQTVRTGLAAYRRDKLMGLYHRAGSGRRSRLRPEQWDQIHDWVQQGPKALGYLFAIWTPRSLRTYISNKFTVWLSRERIRQVLHQICRSSWTRAKKVYAYPDDPERTAERNAFCQQMAGLLDQARNREIILLLLDETIFTLAGESGIVGVLLGQRKRCRRWARGTASWSLAPLIRSRDAPTLVWKIARLTRNPRGIFSNNSSVIIRSISGHAPCDRAG